MKLSDNLKNIRKENNLSQEQLAEMLGVSRQAVSKWESGSSYPEMEKVLLICKLFNYNIDELMNENVKQVDENKQSKINFNKYINEFFAYITKTVKMFSSMTFKQKIKCVIEQLIVIGIIVSILAIIGEIGSSVLSGVVGGLSYSIIKVIRNIIEAIYLILAFVLGFVVYLHIFKIRYLDYYEIIEENGQTETKDENIKQDNQKILLENKKEKIIIRDPNHSQYNFLTSIAKIVMCGVKFFAICIALGFATSLIFFVTCLILSFLFIKTGMLFVGLLVGLISAIIVNIIILEILYNFIISKKSNKTRLAITFIISLVLAGVSGGLITIGVSGFEYVNTIEASQEIEDTYKFTMSNELWVNSYANRDVEYIANDSNEIKVVVKHSKFYEPNVDLVDNVIYVRYNADSLERFRTIINDINNKRIVNYYNPSVYVYTSQDNINKLEENATNAIEKLYR